MGAADWSHHGGAHIKLQVSSAGCSYATLIMGIEESTTHILQSHKRIQFPHWMSRGHNWRHMSNMSKQ